MRRLVRVALVCLAAAQVCALPAAAAGDTSRLSASPSPWQIPAVGTQPEVVIDGLVDHRGFSVAPDGTVIVADFGGYRVLERKPGRSTQVVYDGPGKPHGAALTADGRILITLYFGGADAGNLLEISPDGQRRMIYMPGDSNWPAVGLVSVADDGSVIVTALGYWVRRYTSDLASYTTLFEGHCLAAAAPGPSGQVAISTFGYVNCGYHPEFWDRVWVAGTAGTPNEVAQSYSVLGGGVAFDKSGRWYATTTAGYIASGDADGNVITIPSPITNALIQISGDWLYVGTGTQIVRYKLTYPVVAPASPTQITATASDSSAVVTWTAPAQDGGSPVTSYTVTATPGGATCTTASLGCTVMGLSNRQRYTFTVTATNEAGASSPSSPSAQITPLAPGFQAWLSDQEEAPGASVTLNMAQAAPGATITVSGALKATLTADATGFASTPFIAAKGGIAKFAAAYTVKVGKKTTKYTATTQLYVPSVSGPTLKIKTGKTGKFSLQFMPPGATASIALTDGRTLSGIADAAGKATFTPTFSIKGAVNYSVSVAGVQIATGGLTVI